MPRISKRARVIRDLEAILIERLEARQTRMLLMEDDPQEDAVDLATYMSLRNAQERRYVFRPGRYRSGGMETRFSTDLVDQAVLDSSSSSESDDKEELQPWLNEEEFIQKYRMTRSSFNVLLNLIKDNPVFHTGKKKKQAPVAYQLMTWLKDVGTEGSGASNANQRNTFGIGYGTATLYRNRVTKAIRDLSPEYIKWPNEEERKEM
jgi:hypothetical protein